MNTPPDPHRYPEPHRRKTMWPGLVWSIPLAAFLLVGYLGLHAWARRGEVVTVTFKRAADAKPNDTKVLYQGVEAGHLVSITPNKDGRRLDFKLRLRPEAKPGLNTNARFWLIGANPNLSDLSSLKAVVSGVAIGYAPGDGGTPAESFEGLERAPTVMPGDRGTRYVLTANSLGSLAEGSGVLFHGQPIGKVTEVKFDGHGAFRLEVFIFQPYDALVKPGVRFWKMAPLHVSFAGGGFAANLAPISTIFSGGVDMEIATADPGGAQSPTDSEFELYKNSDAARQGLTGPEARYEFDFAATSGALETDAAVTLLGFQIGYVESAQLAFDERTGKPFTRATAVIFPHQLGLTAPPAASAADWQNLTDTKVVKLLHFGYRARLQQTPALVGAQSIALVEVKGAAAGDLGDGAIRRIPSAPGASDVADITAQADQILAKVNAIPIEDIGRNLQQITAHLNGLVSSPKMEASLEHLTNTLAQVDKMLNDVQPQVGPLMTKLTQTADELTGAAKSAEELLNAGGGQQPTSNLPEAMKQLTEAARSIRSLADYLDRHPESLIRGKKPEK